MKIGQMNLKILILPNYIFIALVGMLILHFTFPGIKLIPLPWNLPGMIPLVIGVALNLNAGNAFHRVGTTVKPLQESRCLLNNGIYSISSHPMYLGFVLILGGVALLLGLMTPWVIISIFILLMEVVFIQVEGRMLEEKFGTTWVEYKNMVRRWI
jgi:protein-S-isoprenylcysteine O-methyltransferase Ste14